jgi:catechol 2,3-dioxygenase-like lactoylglutathione lyase family enzyme
MMSAFKVVSIDHVELFVPDRYEAAAWYQRVFGLEIIKQFEYWAHADGTGPLMISSDDGATKLALFEGDPIGKADPAGFLRVAFRVTGPGFLDFLSRVESLDLMDHRGERVTVAHAVDHDGSYSIYFDDPYGNRFEITTYEVEVVAAGL